MINDFSLDRDNPLSITRQIADRLENGILNGDLVPGEKLSSERELVKLFQVSKDTIRKALSILSEQGKVIKSPNRGTFVASHALLRKFRQRKRVYVFINMYEESQWGNLIRGLSRELHLQGMDLLLKDTYQWSADDFRQAAMASIDEKPAGFIIYPYFMKELSVFYKKLPSLGVPVVLVDAGINLGIEAVTLDEEQAVSLAVRHLYSLGHRDIGYIPQSISNPCEHGIRRLTAYKKICKELGIESSGNLICKIDMPKQGKMVIPSSNEYRKITSFLKNEKSTPGNNIKRKGLSGIVCYNDIVALQIWKTGESLGLSIPKDLSIVGYDNDSRVETWTIPLTTIEPKMIEIAGTAVRRLIYLMDQNNSTSPNVTYISPGLIVRNSTTAVQS